MPEPFVIVVFKYESFGIRQDLERFDHRIFSIWGLWLNLGRLTGIVLKAPNLLITWGFRGCAIPRTRFPCVSWCTLGLTLPTNPPCTHEKKPPSWLPEPLGRHCSPPQGSWWPSSLPRKSFSSTQQLGGEGSAWGLRDSHWHPRSNTSVTLGKFLKVSDPISSAVKWT